MLHSILSVLQRLFLIDHFFDNKFFLAVVVSFELLIILIIASMFSTAVEIPIKTWAFSSVFFNSNLILLRTFFSLKATNSEINYLRVTKLNLSSVNKTRFCEIFLKLI